MKILLMDYPQVIMRPFLVESQNFVRRTVKLIPAVVNPSDNIIAWARDSNPGFIQ